MANSADPDQLASTEANWSGSPTDLDLHSLQRQSLSGFSRTRVKFPFRTFFPAYTQRQSTNQCCQCFNCHFCTKSHLLGIHWKSCSIATVFVIQGGAQFSLFCCLTLVLLSPDMPCLYKQCRSRSEEANWYGSALFAIKYVNMYQQPGSSNLIGWKLIVVVAS